MHVARFSPADAAFERSPDQSEDVAFANMVDQRHGAPVTIGFGRYGPNQGVEETMAVDDIMIILEGGLTVSSPQGTVTAGPGDIVHMPKGARVAIRAQAQGALTAYVTYPHWQEARP